MPSFGTTGMIACVVHARVSKAGRAVLCATSVLAASSFGALAFDALTSTRMRVAPPMPRPDYLQAAKDPLFGTSFARITEPGRLLAPGMSCRPDYCRHRYSSTQAWNADQSLLAINNGCSNGICFLDGKTYEPAFFRLMSDDCKWHPADPARMICMSSRAIFTWAPRSNDRTIVYAPADYTNLQFGPYKGNPSRGGDRVVVVATDRSGALVAFAYDLSARRKYPDINLGSPERHAYCGISPSGQYVYCFRRTGDGTEVTHIFTTDGLQVQHWTEHHRPGHGDMAIDEDGSDVYVGISKANPDKWHVIKRRLADGKVTVLAPAGYGTHVSTRNINRPGWAFVSYEGSQAQLLGSPGYAPFYREVVAIRLDGSGEIRRIGQTRNAKSDYYSETHASPSPDASQVVWSSNWGASGGPVADYVSRLSWPDEAR